MGAQVERGRRQVPGESCGVKRVSERREGKSRTTPRRPPTLALGPLPLPPFLPPSFPPTAVSELQHLARFHRASCFYRLRVDRPGGNTEIGGHQEGHPQLLGRRGNSPPSAFRSSPSLLRSRGGPGKGVLGTSPLPKIPAVSPDSRRMELRKVPSSSSGSPVLGRQRQRDFGMERGTGCPSRNPQYKPPFPDWCNEAQIWTKNRLGVRQK